MQIHYTYNNKQHKLSGDTMFACFAEIEDKQTRDFCRKNLPINVSNQSFSRIMNESFDWKNIRIIEANSTVAA